MNEIILASNTELGKSALGRTTEKIIKLVNAQIQDEKQIAVAVAEVDRTGAAVDAGFKNTAAWAEQFLNFSKSKVSRYISITRRFKWEKITDEQGRDYWELFSLGQLQEMLKATDEQLQQITPDMTVKDIREYLSFIDVPNDSESEPNDSESEPNDSESEPNDSESEPEREPEPHIDEYTDITIMWAVIKQYLLSNDNRPAMIWRDGDTFKIGFSK